MTETETKDCYLDVVGPAKLPMILVRGEGARLFDDEGKAYWDFYGGHAVTLLGQSHPAWVEAISQQARTLSFCTGLADTPVRQRAARALCAFTGMDKCWLVNSGAEVNEAALKIARKATGRPVVIAMEHGFHGRTMGALGVTWHYRDQHQPAHGETRFVPFGDLAALEAALDDQVAAVMTEVVQGVAGVIEPPPGWLAGVAAATRRNGSVLIIDEVQSGIGRAGWPLLAHKEGVRADLTTVGKSVGGGYPVAALLLTEAMARHVAPGEHGTTYGGGPMACAAIEATMYAIHQGRLVEHSRELGERMKKLFSAIPGVLGVRGDGCWIGLVLDRPARPVLDALLELGFLAGGAAAPDVVRLCPPAVMPAAAVTALARALQSVLSPAVSP